MARATLSKTITQLDLIFIANSREVREIPRRNSNGQNIDENMEKLGRNEEMVEEEEGETDE